MLASSVALKPATPKTTATDVPTTGLVQKIPQNENTPLYARSPYAVAKMYAYWIVANYWEADGIYACNGILFNYDSPCRGETLVTRKVHSRLGQYCARA